MGKLAKPQRSQKHKKMKAVDPNYHGNRKDRRQEGQNQKPKNFEQEVPKKLKLLGFKIHDVKSGKLGKKSKNKFINHPVGPHKYDNQFKEPLGLQTLHKPESIKEGCKKTMSSTGTEVDKHVKTKLTAKGNFKPKLKEKDVHEYIDNLQPVRPFVQPFQFKRKKGESESSFLRRVNLKTNFVLTKSKIDDKLDVSDEKKIAMKIKTKKPGMNEKKKQRLKDKKVRKTEAQKEKKNEKFSGFSALQDKVEFGEVVHAPPVLSVRPKKAVLTDCDRPGRRMPELMNSSKGIELQVLERKPGQSIKRKRMSPYQQAVADTNRSNVIDAYRQSKIKVSKLKS